MRRRDSRRFSTARTCPGGCSGQRADGTENRTGKGYQVEGGILFTTKEDGGNLFTAKEYSDFVLRFEFKLTGERQQWDRYTRAAAG